ncbi:DUF2252 family protein [Streptomyces sp. NPDC096354]|uniref:DUF2252 family protein n=1 Tax=Streptomyces sp. NPDC096354 TaxID=3366088 RepID=UPI003813242E
MPTVTPARLRAFGEVCGTTQARAHVRSGDRTVITAYLGRGDASDRALHTFADAGLNERDHQGLVEVVRADRLSASEPYSDRR